MIKLFALHCVKTNNLVCTLAKSDQTAIWSLDLFFFSSGKLRHLSDWMESQVDLCPHWAQTVFGRFCHSAAYFYYNF